jgi:MoaA/NifB/PqqE/SkfB family radical SAM enzyme
MGKLARFAGGAYAAVAPHRLFQLVFFVTARCNARCKMCFYLEAIEQANRNLPNELSLDEIRTLAAKLGHLPYLSLSGGEPFLRRDLADVVDALVTLTRPVLVSIPTNAAYPDRVDAAMRGLTERHPLTQFDIQLSLDGVGATHDEVRQVPGLFERLMETHARLDKLRAERGNFGVKIVITYSTFNQHQVAALLDYIEANMPADRVILAKAHGNCAPEAKDGLDLELFSQLLTRAEAINAANAPRRNLLSDVNLRIKKGKEKLRQRFEREADLGRFCGAGRKIAVLGETGTVYPCEVLDRPAGNVRDFGLDLHATLAHGMAPLYADGTIQRCHCDWGCAQNIAVVTSPRFWPNLVTG